MFEYFKIGLLIAIMSVGIIQVIKQAFAISSKIPSLILSVAINIVFSVAYCVSNGSSFPWEYTVISALSISISTLCYDTVYKLLIELVKKAGETITYRGDN